MPISVGDGFTVGNNQPVDARFALANPTERFGLAADNVFEGLTVYQTGSGVEGYFILTDLANYNNASGWTKISLPILTSSNGSSTTTVMDFPTSSYDGAVIDYTIKNGNNVRTGTIISAWDSLDNIDFTETSIKGVGDTTDASFTFVVSNATASLQITNTNSYSTVKILARAL